MLIFVNKLAWLKSLENKKFEISLNSILKKNKLKSDSYLFTNRLLL